MFAILQARAAPARAAHVDGRHKGMKQRSSPPALASGSEACRILRLTDRGLQKAVRAGLVPVAATLRGVPLYDVATLDLLTASMSIAAIRHRMTGAAGKENQGIGGENDRGGEPPVIVES